MWKVIVRQARRATFTNEMWKVNAAGTLQRYWKANVFISLRCWSLSQGNAHVIAYTPRSNNNSVG
jgi:hypothetical protein